mmetsp:Transcript_13151/g.29953  ORF Transcript_13151/g.29953 Transcript_13151/m.29953 type:complete len:126 (-) Transcript_13151:22-399(-)
MEPCITCASISTTADGTRLAKMRPNRLGSLCCQPWPIRMSAGTAKTAQGQSPNQYEVVGSAASRIQRTTGELNTARASIVNRPGYKPLYFFQDHDCTSGLYSIATSWSYCADGGTPRMAANYVFK